MAAPGPDPASRHHDFSMPPAVPDLPHQAVEGTGCWVYAGYQPRTSCGIHRHSGYVQALFTGPGAEYIARWRHGRDMQERLIAGGQVWLVPEGRDHAVEWLRPAVVVVLYLKTDWATSVTGHVLRQTSLEPLDTYVRREPLIGELLAKFQRTLRLHQSPPDSVIASLGSALGSQLLEAHFAPRAQQPAIDRLSRSLRDDLLRFIARNLGEKLTLKKLADQAGLAPSYFGQRFKASVGLSPMSYILDQRVIWARDLLRAGKHSIAEIAVITGFGEQSKMTRRFRALLNTTPGCYLARDGEENRP